MHRDAARFSHGHQAGNNPFLIPGILRDDLAVIVGRDATHVVVDGWQDRYRFLRNIDPGKNSGRFSDSG